MANRYNIRGFLLQELLRFAGPICYPDMARRMEYVQAENQIYRSRHKRLTLTTDEKYMLLKKGLALGGELKRLIGIVHYSTFRRWATGSIGEGEKAVTRGRPRITRKEMNDIIVRMAKENPGWGFARIRAELYKLYRSIPSRNTVKAILRRNGMPISPVRNQDSWDAIMKRSFETLWACDFFTQRVWTILGPKTFYVLFFINVRTRRVYIAGMTPNPSKEWVDRATKRMEFLSKKNNGGRKLLVRDGDQKFTGGFNAIFRSHGIEVRIIPARSPNLNPYAESWVSTIKRECLNHYLILGAQHFKHLVREYVHYYNVFRPHSGHSAPDSNRVLPDEMGTIECRSWLNGFLKHYYRRKYSQTNHAL